MEGSLFRGATTRHLLPLAYPIAERGQLGLQLQVFLCCCVCWGGIVSLDFILCLIRSIHRGPLDLWKGIWIDGVCFRSDVG